MSSLLSKASSALSQELHTGAVNAAEPFAAHDEASKMKMLPVEQLCNSLGCRILGVSLPYRHTPAQPDCCWAELGVAVWQVELLITCLD